MEYTNVDRIIAKIDNDFNPNNSDWIPRVGAWVHDALAQLDVTQTEIKSKRLKVEGNIARSDCPLPNDIKVYDSEGCKIKETSDNFNCCGNNDNDSDKDDSFTGVCHKTPQTIDVEISDTEHSRQTIAITHQSRNYPPRYNVIEVDLANPIKVRKFTRVNDKTIEINYDNEDYITVKYNAPKTYKCDKYGCEMPVIPDNGKLIEAITYYCMYKMLCRGYKHPVFNLAASQYGTNPFFIWNATKEEAKRSVINDGTNEDLDYLWRSAMFINTFYPKI